MPRLTNNKKELFAQTLATGKYAIVDAYVRAGYSAHEAYTPAIAMAQSLEIKERIAEIQKDSSQQVDLYNPAIEREFLETEIVSPEEIDEEWLLKQTQLLLQASKQAANFKVARDLLLDIGDVRGIGAVRKKIALPDGNHDALPPPVKSNISDIFARLQETRNELTAALEDATDITPIVEPVPNEDDGNVRPSKPTESDK